jgi:hypothetical protein
MFNELFYFTNILHISLTSKLNRSMVVFHFFSISCGMFFVLKVYEDTQEATVEEGLKFETS